jgi:predicted O-methyltransferase YrrM
VPAAWSASTDDPLNVLAKVAGRSPQRRSRLHTLSGERVPVSELPQFALAALRRTHVIPSRPQPWMSHRAVSHLARVLRPDQRLLELGSGTSTVWYAAHVAEVVSIEDDPAWAKHAQALARDAGQHNARVVASEITRDLLLDLLREPWDVVVVDQNENSLSRPEAVSLLVGAASPPSLVVMDDSDRPHYQPALTHAVAQGWQVLRFPGYKSRPLSATETAVLMRRR